MVSVRYGTFLTKKEGAISFAGFDFSIDLLYNSLTYADDSTVNQEGAHAEQNEDQVSGVVVLFQYDQEPAGGFGITVQAWRVREGFYDHSKETELSLT